MKKIILEPLTGIRIEDNELIEFGISKFDLLKKLGKPSSQFENQLFYDDLELRIDIDNEEQIEFIEFIDGPFPEKTEIEVYEIDPFKTESSELLEVLTEQNNGQVDDSEEPYCYAFLETSIGVFRDSCESDVNEIIAEMKANGENPEQENWVLADKQKAKYFWTIGIGKKGYYK